MPLRTGSRRIPAAALTLTIAGGLLIAASLLSDILRHQPFDFGTHQAIGVLFGALLLFEGVARLVGVEGPALWTLLQREGRESRLMGLTLAFGVLATLLWFFRVYAADDAWITFRYSRWLAEGHGVVWNLGEPPVEGYSNFIWMLLAAGAIRLGLDPLFAMRIVGVLCHAAARLVVRRIVRERSGSAPHADLVMLLFAAVPAFAYWTMSGLETISVVLFSLLYLRALGHDTEQARLPWRSALFADLLLLSRPDAPLLIVVPVLVTLWPLTRARVTWALRLALTALPVAVAYLAWKFVTFHRLFANTVSAKLRFAAGIPMLSDFYLVAFPLVLLWCLLPPSQRDAFHRRVGALCAAYLLTLFNAAPQVGHYYRFFLPVLAPMLCLVPASLFRAPERTSQADSEHLAPPRPALAAAVVLLYALMPLTFMTAYASREGEALQGAHREIARELQATFHGNGLLAASDCGVVPYFSRMRTIDLWGLTDRHIAEHGFDAAYVLAQAPDVIILHSLDAGTFRGRESYDVAMHTALAAQPGYRIAGMWQFYGYWLWVYSKRPLLRPSGAAPSLGL